MYYVIVNPASRSGKGRKIWEDLRRELDRQEEEYRYYFTRPERDAGKLAACILRKEKETADVILFGGDGSMNELLQGVAALGENAFERLRLFYIPSGSASDLARALALPKDPKKSLARILAAKRGETENAVSEHPTDIGVLEFCDAEKKEYNGTKRYFIVSAGIGFDAAVCAEVAASPLKKFFNRMGLGGLSYGFICIKNLLAAPRNDAELILDRRQVFKAKNCLFVTIMNHKFQGGGVMFTPEAVSDDGLLDYCYTDGISRAKVLGIFPKVYKGRHVGTKGIMIGRAGQLVVTFPEHLWVHTDGEVRTRARAIGAKCLPGRLRLLV
ncbi:MAG: hypothetical protein IKO11_05770 [Lachnospiraceae bacterium]|nr:hypothetical protein [Lachnospiraceae bacterium]